MATILCVEDEPHIREDIVEELEDAGYDVIEASDGREALALILSKRPDLVVSDINMPIMNGMELLREVRNGHPELSDMPFIFLSAFNDRDAVREGLKKGADDYLTKPIDFDMLVMKVKASMRQNKRMLDKKQKEQVRIYRALKKDVVVGEEKRQWPQVEKRKIVCVGNGDKETWQIMSLLSDELGHDVRFFTSGKSYLGKAEDKKFQADLTLLWLYSDDMQGPMVRKMAGSGKGKYVLVVPNEVSGKAELKTQHGFLDTVSVPISNQAFVDKLTSWIAA